MKVHWTDKAVEQLANIHEHIAKNSPKYALRVIDRLTRRSQQIGNFPFSGRKVSEFEHENIREVIEGPYRIIYYIGSDQIDILAVIHGAQQTPWNK